MPRYKPDIAYLERDLVGGVEKNLNEIARILDELSVVSRTTPSSTQRGYVVSKQTVSKDCDALLTKHLTTSWPISEIVGVMRIVMDNPSAIVICADDETVLKELT